jgi:hypothetical protein
VRSLRFVPALIVIVAMLAACTGAATPNPDGGDGNGNPTAATGDGKGGGTGDGKGTGTGTGGDGKGTGDDGKGSGTGTGGDGKGSGTGTGGDGKGGGGTKPAGWDRFGKASYTVSGGLSASGEAGFVPAGSIFGGPTNTSLSYTIEGTQMVLIIRLGVSGGTTGMILQFSDGQVSVPAAQCTTTNLNVGSTSASGNYQCAAAMGMNANGAMFMNVGVAGSFTASAT